MRILFFYLLLHTLSSTSHRTITTVSLNDEGKWYQTSPSGSSNCRSTLLQRMRKISILSLISIRHGFSGIPNCWFKMSRKDCVYGIINIIIVTFHSIVIIRILFLKPFPFHIPFNFFTYRNLKSTLINFSQTSPGKFISLCRKVGKVNVPRNKRFSQCRTYNRKTTIILWHGYVYKLI